MIIGTDSDGLATYSKAFAQDDLNNSISVCIFFFETVMFLCLRKV